MSDDNELTAEEQAALDAQRNTPEPEAPEQPDAPETPQEGAVAQEEAEGVEPPAADDKRPQTVPHAALHAERERRKEVERQAAEDRRRYEARVEKLLELVPQPAAPVPASPERPPLPDPQQDPAGYIIADMQQKGASIEQINQRIAAFEQQQQQQQVVTAIQQRAAAMEVDYRAQNPEYDSAMTFLRSFRDRQLQAAGIMDPGQRAQQIAAEAFQIAAGALQQGGNPAERLHRLAEASGWAAQAPAAPNAAAPVEQPTPAVPDQAARLRMIQQGQDQSRGLGNVRGNGPSPMTAQKLLDMPEDDLDAVIKAMRSPAARRLMGA